MLLGTVSGAVYAGPAVLPDADVCVALHPLFQEEMLVLVTSACFTLMKLGDLPSVPEAPVLKRIIDELFASSSVGLEHEKGGSLSL